MSEENNQNSMLAKLEMLKRNKAIPTLDSTIKDLQNAKEKLENGSKNGMSVKEFSDVVRASELSLAKLRTLYLGFANALESMETVDHGFGCSREDRINSLNYTNYKSIYAFSTNIDQNNYRSTNDVLYFYYRFPELESRRSGDENGVDSAKDRFIRDFVNDATTDWMKKFKEETGVDFFPMKNCTVVFVHHFILHDFEKKHGMILDTDNYDINRPINGLLNCAISSNSANAMDLIQICIPEKENGSYTEMYVFKGKNIGRKITKFLPDYSLSKAEETKEETP